MCKEHPCPSSPDLGLWRMLEVSEWGLASWYWFGYGHCSLAPSIEHHSNFLNLWQRELFVLYSKQKSDLTWPWIICTNLVFKKGWNIFGRGSVQIECCETTNVKFFDDSSKFFHHSSMLDWFWFLCWIFYVSMFTFRVVSPEFQKIKNLSSIT